VRTLADLGFAGANVTIPHKEAAFALCDEVDGVARRAGSVNTLVVRGGKVLGTSTDGYGFLESVREQAPGWRAADGPAWCSAPAARCGRWPPPCSMPAARA
jgi:shikimate dehydrogenase